VIRILNVPRAAERTVHENQELGARCALGGVNSPKTSTRTDKENDNEKPSFARGTDQLGLTVERQGVSGGHSPTNAHGITDRRGITYANLTKNK